MIDITNGKLQVTASIIITIPNVVLSTKGGTPNDINLSFGDGLSLLALPHDYYHNISQLL